MLGTRHTASRLRTHLNVRVWNHSSSVGRLTNVLHTCSFIVKVSDVLQMPAWKPKISRTAPSSAAVPPLKDCLRLDDMGVILSNEDEIRNALVTYLRQSYGELRTLGPYLLD